jgi:hypothetical protein
MSGSGATPYITFTSTNFTVPSFTATAEGAFDPNPGFPLPPPALLVSGEGWSMSLRVGGNGNNARLGFSIFNVPPVGDPAAYGIPDTTLFTVAPGIATNFSFSYVGPEPSTPSIAFIYDVSGEMNYAGSGLVSWTLSASAQQVPEPATWGLLAMGIVGIGALRWRSRR